MTVDPILVVWVLVYVVLVLGSIFHMAWTNDDDPVLVAAIATLGMFWPFILPFAVVAALGFGFYKLVRYVRIRQQRR